MAMAFVLANTSFADHGIQAINGHTMELDGDIMIVQGVISPHDNTKKSGKSMTNTRVSFKDAFLCSWDGRPAASYSPSKAIAILAPGEFWMPVDALDVHHTAKVIATRRQFKKEFAAVYGPPVESAADWYDKTNPHEDLLSKDLRTEEEFNQQTGVEKIIVMANATKDTRIKT